MQINTEHIISYLEGRLSPEERNEFEKLLNTSPDFKKEVEDMAYIWKISSELNLYQQADTKGNWEKVSRKIKADKFSSGVWRFIRSAAAILLLPVLILTSVLYYKIDKINDHTPISQLEIKAAYGTVTRTSLPDGTQVWLNSGSTLSYPQVFRGNKRMVNITGEAYFQVTSDKANRFEVVVADELIVSAYGTEFNINAHPEDNTIDVTLVNGNIEVADMDHSISHDIAPGQHIAYHKINRDMDISYANLSVKTGWKDGKMIFRRAAMTEVIQRLSRHFNVDIRLEGEELYEYEYSATFTTETLHEILNLLEKTASIKYRIIEPEQSDDYTFNKRVVIISVKK